LVVTELPPSLEKKSHTEVGPRQHMMHVAARVCMMFRCLGAYNEDSTYKFISNEECSELAAHVTDVIIFLAYRLTKF